MAQTFQSSGRTAVDVALFAGIFFGVILSVAGIITNSFEILAFGGFFVALGFIYFLIQNLLRG